MIKIITPTDKDCKHEKFKYIDLLLNILGGISIILAIFSGYNYLTSKQVSNLTLSISIVFMAIFLLANYRYIHSKIKFCSKRFYNTIKYYLISKYYFGDLEFFSSSFRTYVNDDVIRFQNMSKKDFDNIMNKSNTFNKKVQKSIRGHKTLFNLVGELGDLICSYSDYINNVLVINKDSITNDQFNKYDNFRNSYNHFANYFLLYSPIMILCNKIGKEFLFRPYNFLNFQIKDINYDKIESSLKRQKKNVKLHMDNIEKIKWDIEETKQELDILYPLRDDIYATSHFELHKLIHILEKVMDCPCLIKDKELVEHLKEYYIYVKLLFNNEKCDDNLQNLWTETIVPKIKKEINVKEKDKETLGLRLSFEYNEIDDIDI